MEYLIKVSGLVVIFFTFYKLFLERETFFQHNRFFLLFGLVSSFTIPFLIIPIYVEQEILPLQNFNITENIVTPKHDQTPFKILDYLPSIYLIGVFIFSARFLFQLCNLFHLLIINKPEFSDGFYFVKTTKKINPFSFFKWIVYNPNQYQSNELEHILTHEKTHVNQYHSIDVLFSQITSIALWFNPVIWLYSKSLKQNLEFIADKLTQNKIDCKKSYQYTLLKTSTPSHQLAITNNFYNSLIKKRIVMLHKSKSKKINYLKYLLVMPILCWFLMSFNAKEVIIKTPKENAKIKTQSVFGDQIDFYIEKDMSDGALERIKTDLENKGYTLEWSNIKRDKNGYLTSINITISYKKSNTTSFSSNSTSPLKTIKITIDQKDHSISIGNSENNVFNLAPALAHAQLLTGENPLYVIDGKIIKEKGFSLQKYDIEAINVLKHKEATEKYGDKGRNGVIEITNKNKVQNKVHLKTTNGKTPLYIINDKESKEEEFENLDPDSIKAMSVLKGKKAIEKYGDKGKNGVLIIDTKQKHTFKLPKQALYIIDGTESNFNQFEKLSSFDIESINVLKGQMAIDKYDANGKNGVIEIITKNN